MRVDHSPTRIAAYNIQRGRCCYCRSPMWERKLESEIHAASRIVCWDRKQPRIYNQSNLNDFVCTAEHAVAQSNGGGHDAANIVAACWFCNSRRGSQPIEAWRAQLAAALPISVDRLEPVAQLDNSVQMVRAQMTWSHVVHVRCTPLDFFKWKISPDAEGARFSSSDCLVIKDGHTLIETGYRVLVPSRAVARRLSRHTQIQVV